MEKSRKKCFLAEAQLKDKIARMSLKEKLLELTQYNSFLLVKEGEEITVTGTSILHGLDTEELWGMGSTLNTRDAEEINALRKNVKRGESRNPLPSCMTWFTVTALFIPYRSRYLARSIYL